MNADSIREFFKNRGEIGDLFHVEQLREYVCQVKRNVLWSGTDSQALLMDHLLRRLAVVFFHCNKEQ